MEAIFLRKKSNSYRIAILVVLSLCLSTHSSYAQSSAQALHDAQVNLLEQQRRSAELVKEQAEKEAEQAQVKEDQKQAQEDARDNKQGGAKAANMLGLGLIAAGTVMVIIGSMPPPGGNPGLLPPGLFMLAGGMGAMMAGAAMGQNANQNQGFANNLDSLNAFDPGPNPGFNVDDGTPRDGFGTSGGLGGNSSNGVAPLSGGTADLNPDDLRNGTLGEIFDKFEAETGLDREEFARGLLAGKTPAELLEGKLKNLTNEQLQEGIDVAQGNILSGDGLNSELASLADEAGLSELYAKFDAAKDGTTDFSNGSGGKSLAGGAAPAKKLDLASILGTKDKKFNLDTKTGADVDIRKLASMKPKTMQRDLGDRDSIFSRVSRRYKKVSRIMLGFIPTGLSHVEESFQALEEDLQQQ